MNAALVIAFGAFFSGFAAYAFRLLPDKWVCDYGEQPQEKHAAKCRAVPMLQIVLIAVAGGACAYLAGRSVTTSVLAAFLCSAVFGVLMLAALCDAKYQILPDELLAFAAAISAILWLSRSAPMLYPHWYSPLLGAAIGFFGMWAFMLLASKLYKTEAMGFGDVKLMGVAGFLCGASGLAAAALFAVVSAAVVFIVLIVLKKRSQHDMFPFGPFIVAGIIFSICLNPEWHAALQWYIGLF